MLARTTSEPRRSGCMPDLLTRRTSPRADEDALHRRRERAREEDREHEAEEARGLPHVVGRGEGLSGCAQRLPADPEAVRQRPEDRRADSRGHEGGDHDHEGEERHERLAASATLRSTNSISSMRSQNPPHQSSLEPSRPSATRRAPRRAFERWTCVREPSQSIPSCRPRVCSARGCQPRAADRTRHARRVRRAAARRGRARPRCCGRRRCCRARTAARAPRISCRLRSLHSRARSLRVL